MGLAGYEVAAMSFTGHGQHCWRLWQRGLKDFEQDLMTAISEFDTLPILVAHSLGGLIAQRVAQRVPVSAAFSSGARKAIILFLPVKFSVPQQHSAPKPDNEMAVSPHVKQIH